MQADIWSLGITAIEMAEGRPPLAEIHAYRALFMIPSRPPPTLKQRDRWSPEFHDFLAKCLQKKPQDRWDVKQLLQARSATNFVGGDGVEGGKGGEREEEGRKTMNHQGGIHYRSM